MHLHIGFVEFMIFGLYLILWKFILHLINTKARGSDMTTVAGISGLLA